MSLYCLVACFFLALHTIPLSGGARDYLCIHLLKSTLIASKLYQLWIKLIQTSVSRFLSGYMFSAPSGKHQGVWVLDHTIRVCLVLQKNWQTAFQSDCTILCSHSSKWEFLFLHTLPVLGIVSVPLLDHSNKSVWYLIVALICISHTLHGKGDFEDVIKLRIFMSGGFHVLSHVDLR